MTPDPIAPLFAFMLRIAAVAALKLGLPSDRAMTDLFDAADALDPDGA